ncbi:TPA: hypothetical protein ACOLZI_004601 [Vibrio parahaemolyticus]
MDKAISIIKILFTKSLNSVGFVLVLAGITALNPDMIISLIYLFLELSIPEFQQDKVLGWSLIIVGIFCFLLNHQLNKGESSTVKQDKSNFIKLNKIVRHQDLNIMLNDIGANNTIFSNYEDILDNLESYLDNDDTDFYNRKLKKLRKQLKSDLGTFLSFTRRNYFRLDENRATLRPDFKHTDDFDTYTERQNRYMESFRKSYNKLRNAVKKQYKI